MIEVKNVVKTFDGFAALNDATLSVPTGAVYGLEMDVFSLLRAILSISSM